MIYGQTELVKDLIAARLETGSPLLFKVEELSVHGLESERPPIRFRHEGALNQLECDVIAGCDGFRGACRQAVPRGVLRSCERDYTLRLARDSRGGRPVERRARLRPQ